MPEITLEKLMSRFGAEMEVRSSEPFISRRRDIMPTKSCPNLLQEYTLGQKIGQGTYGHVVKGWKKGPNGEKVGPTLAIKELDLKFYNSEDGYPSIFTREIRILQRLPNCRFVVKLLDIASSDAPLIFNDNTEKRMQTFLVFEYVSHDLAGLLSHHKFEVEEVRVIFSQLLQGLCFIHAHRIVHRDLKLSNILISNEGVVKIADFGLSRLLREKEGEESYMTARIVTLWYRSVELLLGSHTYGTAVDMWSSGCILGEMLSQRPLFSSDNEQKVFQRICQLLGSPNAETLPQRHDYPKWQEMREIAYTTSERLGGTRQIREKFEKYGEESLALLEGLLMFDPRKRATAEDCARSPWFDKPTTPKAFQFLAIPPKRELDARKSRANKSSQEATTSGTRKSLGADDHLNSRAADQNLASEDVNETPSKWPFPKTVGVPNQVCHTLEEHMAWKSTHAKAEKLRLKQRKKDVRRFNRDKRAKLRELKAIRLSKMETKGPRKPNNNTGGRLRTTMNTRPHSDHRDYGWRGHRDSHPVRVDYRDQNDPPPSLLENPRESGRHQWRGYSNFYGPGSHYYGRQPLPDCRDRDPPRNAPRDRGWKPPVRSNSRSDSRRQSSRSRSRRKRPVRRSVYGMPRRR